MKLHTVFITYNRLELTKRALASYLETVTLPFSVGIVDNGSTDGTQEWLRRLDLHYSLGGTVVEAMMFPNNRYPGYACNYGFANAPDDATHLHRADNDFVFLPGWCDEVQRRFSHIKKLGQLGLRTNQEESSSINVGGNCIFTRAIWRKGLRYDERPWPQIRDEVGPGWTEDSLMSGAVRNMGYAWTRVQSPCIQSISFEATDDPYYQATWEDRGIST